MILDTRRMKLFLTSSRIQKTQELAASFLRRQTSNLIDLTQLLGLLVSNMDALQWRRFHTRDLQMFLRPHQQQIARKANIRLYIPAWVQHSLRWRTKPSNLDGGRHLPGATEVHITTDASLHGWGAVCDRQTAQGTWSAEETILPINLLELRAIRLALLHVGAALQSQHVLIRTDNVAAKAHVNKLPSSQGVRPSVHMGGNAPGSQQSTYQGSKILWWTG